MSAGCANASNREYPGVMFYFLPADIVSQTLNFSLPAPYDVQIVGRDQGRQPCRGRATGRARSKKIPRCRGCARCSSRTTGRQFSIKVDRSKAADLGLTEQSVANSVLLGPERQQPGAARLLARPQGRHPVPHQRARPGIRHGFRRPAQRPCPSAPARDGEQGAQILANLATIERINISPVFSHYNVLPTIDVFGRRGWPRPRRCV